MPPRLQGPWRFPSRTHQSDSEDKNQGMDQRWERRARPRRMSKGQAGAERGAAWKLVLGSSGHTAALALPEGHTHGGGPCKDPEPQTAIWAWRAGGSTGGTLTLTPWAQVQGNGQASEGPPAPVAHRRCRAAKGPPGPRLAALHEPRWDPRAVWPCRAALKIPQVQVPCGKKAPRLLNLPSTYHTVYKKPFVSSESS